MLFSCMRKALGSVMILSLTIPTLILLLATVAIATEKIAFVTDRDGNYEIYLMEEDVSSLINLTQNPLNDVEPAFSPDGSRIAFSSNRNGKYQVYTIHVDRSNLKQLTTFTTTGGYIYGISWHPEGTKLIFTNLDENNRWQIYQINEDGTDLTKLTEGSWHHDNVRYSIDGSKIYLQYEKPYNGYTREIYVCDADGSNLTRLTFSSTGTSRVGTSGRPAGDIIDNGVPKVFFERQVGNPRGQIFKMNIDGSEQKNISNNPYYDTFPERANGAGIENELMFISDRDGMQNVWKMNTDGSNPVQITFGGAREVSWWVGETDDDNDGIPDDEDNCPFIANTDQSDDDEDGFGDACDECPNDSENDFDQDGVCGDLDNCPLIWNPDQDDFDEDGIGDLCDRDDDNDGVQDGIDQCPSTPFGEIINEHGCSIGDICPCDNEWKNHGAYVKCVAQSSEAFVSKGLITEALKDSIVSNAAESDCGHKK